MTSTREVDRRLSELEDDEPTGEPLSLCEIIAAEEEGVDPVEKYGGYIPESIVELFHEMAEAEETNT